MFRWLLIVWLAACVPATGQVSPLLKERRTSPSDLEVSGQLRGLPPGTTRYIAYQDLLWLPQATCTVTNDTNFVGGARIAGVPLTELTRVFGETPEGDLVVALSYDGYRTNYSRRYMASHKPLLVLTINGKPPDKWPKSEHDGPMGPYLISHPAFQPAFRILSHTDEPQIPYGVTRIELRSEAKVFQAIHPPVPYKLHSQIDDGYRIAQQNCFRCHHSGEEGGQMAHRSWLVLAAWAATDQDSFKRYLRNPLSVNPASLMPANPQYDMVTADALAAYFRTFLVVRRPE